MPEYKREKRTLYEGQDEWVNTRTGQVVTADQFITKTERQGFEITYLMYLFDLFNELGGQKYKVVKYILEKKDSNNTLIITQRELAEKCNVGINTATDTIKILRDAGLIQTKTGAIMINPKLAHRGSNSKEKYLLHKFTTFDDK